MIRCPKCGTLNRDNSHFCNECGTPLQRTKVRCPKCGALNAVGNVFCDRCNARLIPTADLAPPQAAAPPAETPAPSLKGISLPTRSSTTAPEGAPEEAELPDWLLELTDESAPIFPEEEEELAEAELPDWLSGLSDELPPGTEAPDMASMEEQPAPAELSDWMADLVSEEPAPPAEADLPIPEEPLAPTELPDWLLDTGEESRAEPVSRLQEGAPSQEDLPDWLSGISPEEPTDQEPGEGEQALPDWLSTLQEEIPPELAIDTGREEVAEPVAAAEELPDWLSSLTDEETPESVPEEEERPTGLTGLTFEEPQEPGEEMPARKEAGTVVPPELPDWMSDISEPEPVYEEAEEEEALAPLELPDWMSDVSEPEPAYEEFLEKETIAPLESPEWVSGDVGDKAGFGAPVESQLPDWILKNADKEPAAVPFEPRALPSWLLAKALPEAAQSQPAPPVELPAWLLTHADQAPPPAKQPPVDWREAVMEEIKEPEMALPEQAPLEEETPDWMAGLLAEEPAEEITEPGLEEGEADWFRGTVAEEPEELEQAPAAQELPDWLGGIDIEEPTPGGLPEPEEELAPAEMPDWLAGVVEETALEEEVAEETPVLEKLPDWLSGMGIEETPAEEPAPFEAEQPQEQLPDWVRGVTEEPVTEAPPSEALPDWLTETEEEAPVSDQAGIFAGEPPAPAVPDWLSDLADVTGMGETGSAVFTEASIEDLQPEAPALASAGPDWLPQTPDSDLMGLEPVAPAFIPEAMEDIEAEAPTPPGEGDLEAEAEQAPPSWLSELVPSVLEEESPIFEELPADESLARAEVPMWLQELRPPGTGPLPSLPEGAGRPEAEIPSEDMGGLARAEIPDWVQALRRATTLEEAGTQLEPAEQLGPLAGLPGVVSPVLAVDIPADFQVPPRPEIPEAIVQQAQLWQQLLEQPRGKTRLVARQRARPGAGTTIVRLLVSALLIIAAVVGFVVVDNRLSSTQPDSRPGIAAFRDMLQALQPGDSVILAVEYGLAETAEMQPIAETLIEHLADRQVDVIAVSTLPEGVGLIYELLEASGVTNRLPEGTSPYLPGTYSGIANFLKPYHDERDGPLLLILASRADRVRWWVEQNNVSQEPLPMGVAVSASIGPRVAPYFNAESIQGWLVGLSDMVTYREFNGDSLRIANYILDFGRILDALMLTHWAASGLILFGLLYALAAGKKGTK